MGGLRHVADNSRPTLNLAVFATAKATRLCRSLQVVGSSLASGHPIISDESGKTRMAERKEEKKKDRRRCFTAQHRAQYSLHTAGIARAPRISGMSLYAYMDDGDAF